MKPKPEFGSVGGFEKDHSMNDPSLLDQTLGKNLQSFLNRYNGCLEEYSVKEVCNRIRYALTHTDTYIYICE